MQAKAKRESNEMVFLLTAKFVLLLMALFFISLALTGCSEKDDNSSPLRINKKKGQQDSKSDQATAGKEKEEEAHASSSEYWLYPENPNVLKSAGVRLVTDVHGPLVLAEGTFKFKADHQAWSSWWYPMREGQLLSGLEILQPQSSLTSWIPNIPYLNPEKLYGTQKEKKYISTLVKFDLIMKNQFGISTQAARYHADSRYNPQLPPWSGYCTPRAYASFYEPEPQRSALIGNVCLSVEDQKILLIHLYEHLDPESWQGWFGQRNDGRPQDIYADIYPHELIKFIQLQLGKEKQAFVLDHNPGVEVWSEVVHAADIESQRIGPHQLSVRLVLKMADYELNPDQRKKAIKEPLGTVVNNRFYTADFFGQWEDDALVVKSSRWTDHSILDHPDYVIAMPAREKILHQLGSFNPHILPANVFRIFDLIHSAPSCNPYVE